MEDFHKIRITEYEGADGFMGGTVELDGIKIKGVRNYRYEAGVGSVKVVTLEIIVDEISIERETSPRYGGLAARRRAGE